MRRPTRRRRAITASAVAAAIVFSVGACGGNATSGGGADKTATSAESSAASSPSGSGDTTDTTKPSDTTGTTTTAQPPADPADVALAESALLTVEDLPTGWKADPSPSEESTFDDARMHKECPAVTRAFDDLRERQGRETGKARASFLLGDQGLPGIQSSVVVTADAEIAGEGYSTYTSGSFRACLLRIFLSSVEADGSSAGELLTAPLPIAEVGDEAEAIRVTVPISANGTQLTVFLDYVVIRVDKVLRMLLIGSADLFPLPDGTETRAIAAAADVAA